MTPNGLQQLREHVPFCEYDPEALDKLIDNQNKNTEAISHLTRSIEVLTTYYREQTRWLLIVVCVIALGSKLVEMAKDIWGAKVISVATAENR